MISAVAAIAGALSGLGSWLLLRRRQPRLLAAPWKLPPFIVTASGLCAIVAMAASDDQTALVAAHLTAVAIPLALVDAVTMKLPRTVVYAAYPSTIALLTIITPTMRADKLLTAALAAVALTAVLYALALAGGLGAGDVRLAPVLGAHLGWAGWPTLLTGLTLAFAIGAAVAIIPMTFRAVDAHDRIPFGPALLTGSLIAILL